MKHIACGLFAGLLVVATRVVAADAANATRIYIDHVEPAHQLAYETAVKHYNRCLGEHGFKYTWRTRVYETGNTQTYAYTAGPYAWTDFDRLGDTDKDCEATWRTEASPHLHSETSAFLVPMPEFSRAPADDHAGSALISVTAFTLKPTQAADQAFLDVERKIAAAAQKSNWPGRYTLYKTRAGDSGFPDYVITVPYKNWAAYGSGYDPSVWQMVDNVYGSKAAAALRKSFDDAMVAVSTHIERYNEELSYVARDAASVSAVPR